MAQRNFHEPYIINGIIGVLSSIVDNVPLVAACMNMYPVMTDAMIATSSDPTYAAFFVEDGLFWHLLTFCAGVGGSILIIGSAAGVVAMGIEKIPFLWYANASHGLHSSDMLPASAPIGSKHFSPQSDTRQPPLLNYDNYA